MQVTENKVLLNCKLPIDITEGRGTQVCMKYDVIIMKEIVTMTTTGPCGMSSPSPKFFDSKFPDVPLFRPNLFIEDNLRGGWGIPPSSHPRSPLSW